jgi:polyferredoxin
MMETAEHSLAASQTGGKLAGVVAAALVVLVLVPVQLVTRPPMLLAERFFPGAGWGEILGLALYAAWLCRTMVSGSHTGLWRQRLWRLFSLVFFTQLLLGLMGIDRCLMSGNLHLPVPALIIAGPIYRCGGLFMPVLLAITILLAGPIWCSYLCYIGAWDDIAARHRVAATPLPRWRNLARLAVLLLVVGTAYLLRELAAPISLVIALPASFGLAGVAIMATLSRRTGAMVHCAAFCPIGWLTTTLGRLNPFRIRIQSDCLQCGLCYPVCRYDALSKEHVISGKAGPNCTLCGDCIDSCPRTQIHYTFPGLSPTRARTAFLVLAVVLHTLFLALGRL